MTTQIDIGSMWVWRGFNATMYTEGKAYRVLGRHRDEDTLLVEDDDGSAANGGKGHYWPFSAFLKNFALTQTETPQQAADALLTEHQEKRTSFFTPEETDLVARSMAAYFGPKLDAQQKNEPGWKMDGGKARFDLLAPEMLFGVSEILAFGAAKYGERNWEAGMSWGRCFGALMRHIWAWWGGRLPTKTSFLLGDLDMETGKSHLWHAACCLMFLIAYEARATGTDDRPGKPVDVVSEV